MQNVEQTAPNSLDGVETTLSSWTINKSQSSLPATIIFSFLLILFLISFAWIFIINKSTDIVSLVIPIILFLIVLATLPEFFKSLKAIGESYEVYLTERGIYKRTPEKKEEPHFIAWDLMSGYDMKYLQSPGLLGKIFIRPTKFFIKSKYSDDSFWLDTFGDDVDILRAYLKEHNVPFGFVQS